MAILKPFRAVRPTKENQQTIPALPYDVMNAEEAREMAKGNPLSFLHVDKAEIDLPVGTNPYDEAVYQTAKKNLEAMEASGAMVKDAQPSFYLYELTRCGKGQTGLVGCASIDDYLNNTIKKHELTRADKEADRIHHVDTCGANTGPIFLTYRKNDIVSTVLGQWRATHSPVYDFVTADAIGHKVWVIEDEAVLATLEAQFKAIDALYVADGHHRCAAAVHTGEKRRQSAPNYTGQEEFNFFLCVAFPDDELQIMDYNRVVADLNGLTKADFLLAVSQKFELKLKGTAPYAPAKKHCFGMFLDGKWYILKAKNASIDESDPVGRLDVSILQTNLLAPILNITDPTTDKRIGFIGGIRGLGELEKEVNGGMAVAFSMFPTTIEDLISIADAGKIMPPKSTWFEPKLLSGLFIHHLEDE